MSLQSVFMENMKKYRKLAGITQEKLAELCNTDPRYIGQIETGRRCPSVAYMEKIADSLNVAPYLLLYDETDLRNGGLPLYVRKNQTMVNTLIDRVSGTILAVMDEYQK
jgi:transcriptional regulator with XRE-family HTH domain